MVSNSLKRRAKYIIVMKNRIECNREDRTFINGGGGVVLFINFYLLII